MVDTQVCTQRTPCLQIWTSTLQRTLLTARHIVGFPKVCGSILQECFHRVVLAEVKVASGNLLHVNFKIHRVLFNQVRP